MLQTLMKIIDAPDFVTFCCDLDKWNSLDVDYHPPRVLRLWRNINFEGAEYRLYLHRILHTDKPCLYHKHRWPSAIFLLEGSYEMGISYDVDPIPPLSTKLKTPTIATFVLNKGSGYEMLDPHGIHYVKPITPDSISVMISGPVFKDIYTKESKNKVLHVLDEAAKKDLLLRVLKAL